MASEAHCNFGDTVAMVCHMNEGKVREGYQADMLCRPVAWHGTGQAVLFTDLYPKLFPSRNDFIPTVLHITAEWEIVSAQTVLAER